MIQNLYRTHSKGKALRATCTVLCENEKIAAILHTNATGCMGAKVELVKTKVEIKVDGKLQTNMILHSWDGDY
jgi:hypothetical protein